MYLAIFLFAFAKIQLLHGGYGATVTNRELRRHLGMSTPTVWRYLRTLRNLGYIERVKHGEHTLLANASTMALGYCVMTPMDYFSDRSLIREIIEDQYDVMNEYSETF